MDPVEEALKIPKFFFAQLRYYVNKFEKRIDKLPLPMQYLWNGVLLILLSTIILLLLSVALSKFDNGVEAELARLILKGLVALISVFVFVNFINSEVVRDESSENGQNNKILTSIFISVAVLILLIITLWSLVSGKFPPW